MYISLCFSFRHIYNRDTSSWEADELGNLGEGGRCGCCGHGGCGQAGRGNSKHGWRIETWLHELEKRVKFRPRVFRNSSGR